MSAMLEQPFVEYELGADLSPNPDGIMNLDDESLFQNHWNLQDTPPYNLEGIYPPPMPRNDPPDVAPVQSKNEAIQPWVLNSLSASQRELLRNIAMPAHIQYPTTREHSPHSATSTRKSDSMSSPDRQGRTRKRKSSTEGMEDEMSGDDSSHRPVKKTAHNMIEKRYRTNLNDKIIALRDSVPSLRVMANGAKGTDGGGEVEDLEGLVPAHKLNKATVLSKATEYIRHLEKRSKRLAEENAAMKSRLDAFEQLFLSGSMDVNHSSNQFNFAQAPYTSGSNEQMNGQHPTHPIPRDVAGNSLHYRRTHQQLPMNQLTYQTPQGPQQPPNQTQGGTNAWSGNGGYFGKVIVGSLAGLTVLDSFSESQSSSAPPDSRGLFALPTQLLDNTANFLRASGDINVFGHHFTSSQTFAYIRLLLMLVALLYVFIPSFFASQAHPNDPKSNLSAAPTIPSITTPIQARRRAWLTAIQTVWVPRHNFFLEAAAIFLKMGKLSLRNLIGAPTYTILTGTTEQQEAARIKAWSIALDAQLVGGDMDVSNSRLTLTLLASATLPTTPARLMLQAMHLRVLLWKVGTSTYLLKPIVQSLAAHFSRRRWNKARVLQQLLQALPATAEAEPLPAHLAALLTHDADDILTDHTIERAYHLTWNLPTTLDAVAESDTILDDPAIRSPLDALAAWFSRTTLHASLEASLLSTPPDPKPLLDTSLSTSPLGSTARLRALAAIAVLTSTNRAANLDIASQEAASLDPPPPSDPSAPPTLTLRSSSAYVPQDVRLALACAATLPLLAHPTDRALAFPAIEALAQPRSLLGFASCYAVLRALPPGEGMWARERLAGALRVGIGGSEGAGVQKRVREGVVKVCVGIVRRCVMEGEEGDAGYVSMSEHSKTEQVEGC